MKKTQAYKRTLAGSVGAGMGALMNGAGRTYYILEFKTTTEYHKAGDSEKVIVDQIELGRDTKCQIRFDDACETVSRKHAAIVREGEGWKLISLSKTNATFVNGQPINGEQILNSGDEIRLSAKGPVIGFIAPQGAKGLVKSIAMTERLKLFQKQALRPYKTGIAVLSVVLVLAVAGLSAYIYKQGEDYSRVIGEMEQALNEQTEKVQKQANQLNAQAAKVKETEKKGLEILNEFNRAKDSLTLVQKELGKLKNVSGATETQLKLAEEKVLKAMQSLEEIRTKGLAESEAQKMAKASYDSIQAEMQEEYRIMKEKNEAYVATLEGKLKELESKSETAGEEATEQINTLKGQLDAAIEKIKTLEEEREKAIKADSIEKVNEEDIWKTWEDVLKAKIDTTEYLDALNLPV
ncbi:MAG: FHA domain-containing protein [Bacteroidaceae bacterium]|nr:FHA domain-containing protein [Bacteroidaceae bacterium]